MNEKKKKPLDLLPGDRKRKKTNAMELFDQSEIFLSKKHDLKNVFFKIGIHSVVKTDV